MSPLYQIDSAWLVRAYAEKGKPVGFIKTSTQLVYTLLRLFF